MEPGAFEGLHARGGEWRIEHARIRWEILDAFRDAAAEAGIPKVDDFNRGDNEGCGYFHVNQKTGVRWNTSKAFLRPVRHRRNLVVETHAQVERLMLDGKRVTGLVRAPARRAAHLQGDPRGDPGGRRHRQPADPAALRHRSGRGAAAARHRGEARARRRGREPAGPSADPLRLQGGGREDHERALPEPGAARRLRGPVRADAARADDHGALPARRLREVRSQPRDAQPAVSHPAAHAAQVRRAARSVPGLHGQRRQHPPDQPRLGAHHGARAVGAARDPAQLSRHRRGPTRGGAVRARDAQHRLHAGAGEVPPRGVPPGPGVPERRGAGQGRRRHLHHHLPPRRHLQDGQRRQAPWSTPA